MYISSSDCFLKSFLLRQIQCFNKLIKKNIYLLSEMQQKRTVLKLENSEQRKLSLKGKIKTIKSNPHQQDYEPLKNIMNLENQNLGRNKSKISLNDPARNSVVNNRQRFNPVEYFIQTRSSLSQNSTKKNQFRTRVLSNNIGINTFQSPEKQKQTVAVEIIQKSTSTQSPSNSTKPISFEEKYKYSQKIINKLQNPIIVSIQQISNAKEQNSFANIEIKEKTNIQNQPNQTKKTCEDIGTSTEILGDSYQEFMKYRMTEISKYQQLQKIFQSITKISQRNHQNQQARLRFMQMASQTDNSTQRETQLTDIALKLQNDKCNITNLLEEAFKSIFFNIQKQIFEAYNNQIKKMQLDFVQIRNQLQSVAALKKMTSSNSEKRKFIQFPGSKCQPNLTKNIQQGFSLNSQLSDFSCLIHQIEASIKQLNAFQTQQKQLMGSIKSELRHEKNRITNKFQQLMQRQNYKDLIVNYCIEETIKLPEMSLTIFGMGDQQESGFDKEVLKKLGVFLEDIPKISEKFIEAANDKQIDREFRTMTGYKCLNCIYLKSQMPYIQRKHSELLPVLKVLIALIRKQKRSIFQVLPIICFLLQNVFLKIPGIITFSVIISSV